MLEMHGNEDCSLPLGELPEGTGENIERLLCFGHAIGAGRFVDDLIECLDIAQPGATLISPPSIAGEIDRARCEVCFRVDERGAAGPVHAQVKLMQRFLCSVDRTEPACQPPAQDIVPLDKKLP